MSIDYKIYKFAEFELDEEEEKLFKNKSDVLLTETEYRILLFLIQRRGKTISTPDLFEGVWGLYSDVDINNVPAHMKGIRNKFGEPDRERFIKTERGRKGYRFVFKPVIVESKKARPVVDDAVAETPAEDSNFRFAQGVPPPYSAPAIENTVEPQSLNRLKILLAVTGLVVGAAFFYYGATNRVCAAAECFEQTIFIWLATVFYGVLSGIGVLLECAYDFDRYGWKAAKMIPSIVLVSAGSMFAALTVAGNMLQANGNYAFWAGLLFLVAGAVASCVLAAFVLPNVPVTAAKFQTQSAIGAFCKNALIYFLPLYTVFGLLVFCFVYGSSAATKNVAFPVALAVVWMFFFFFSYLSTNYLSDNLLTEKDGRQYKYHGLFSLLLQLRMIFCFIAALGSVVWYFIHTLD